MSDDRVDIGNLARTHQITTRTLRFYEQSGLLRPALLDGRRHYSPEDCIRLASILRGRRLGFSLEQLRELLCGTDVPLDKNGVQETPDRITGHRSRLKQQFQNLSDILDELHTLERRLRRSVQQQLAARGDPSEGR